MTILYLRRIVFLLLGAITVLAIFTAFQGQKSLPASIKKLETLAQDFLAKENFDSALFYFQAAKKMASAQGLDEAHIRYVEKELQIIVQHPDYDEAEKRAQLNGYWNGSLQQDAKFQQFYFDSYCSLYLNLGDMDSVEYYYAKTMQAIEKSKDWKYAVNFNTFLAQVYHLDLGDFFKAKDYIEVAEDILAKHLLPKGEDVPDFYSVHAVIAQEVGDYDKALKSALKGVEFLRKDPEVDPLDLAYEYNNLGAIYNALEDYANAEKYYKEALRLSEISGESQEIAVSLYHIGVVCYRKREFRDAERYYKKSLSFLKEEISKDNIENYINCYTQLSDCYILMEQLDSAKHYIKLAEKLHQQSSYRISRTYEKIGRISLKEKKYSLALSYLTKALSGDAEMYGEKHPLVALSYCNIANLYAEQNKHQEALLHFQKAISAISQDFEATADWRKNPALKTVMDKGLMLDILSRKVKTLQALQKTGKSDVQLEDIYATASLATRMLSLLNKSVMNIETKRYWLQREAIPVYEQAISLALELAAKTGKDSYKDEAFQLSERSKSILLMEALQQQNAGAFGGVPDTLIQQERRLARLITNVEKKRFDALLQKKEGIAKQFEQELFQLEHESAALKKLLESKYPKYYKLKYEENVADIASIQAKLDDNTIFIEYFEGFDQTIAFVLRKEGMSSFSVALDSNAQREMMGFQNTLLDVQTAQREPVPAYNRYVSKAHEYYKKYIAPALKAGEKDKRLVLIPDGTLGYIPFESLLTEARPMLSEEDDLPDYVPLPYLMHQHRINYNYSGTLWLSQLGHDAEVVNGRVLAMAPTYGKTVKVDSSVSSERSEKEIALRASLTKLPGAAAEIDFLKSQYDGTFLKGDAANEKNIKAEAGQYGILHLAMHGLVDEKNPEFSSLAMTEDGEPKEDNFFYAYEIKQLDLKAALVVLSACETGAGKYQRGEGVVSIGRGFMYAGAPSLLMTLWSLNDQSGLALIEIFYANIAKGMEKDEALRQAKIAYLEKSEGLSAHPALWACFVQLGNYSSIKIEPKKSSHLWWILGGVGMIFGTGFIVAKRSNNKNK